MSMVWTGVIPTPISLDTIKEIKDDPYKWLDPKSGRPSESVVNLLKNEAKYMSGLGPAGYAEYMDEINKKTPTRSGNSGKPDYFYNKLTGEQTYSPSIAMKDGITKPGWNIVRGTNPEYGLISGLLKQRSQMVDAGEDTSEIDDKIKKYNDNQATYRADLKINPLDPMGNNSANVKIKTDKLGYVVGGVYDDGKGGKVKYLGNDKWQKVK